MKARIRPEDIPIVMTQAELKQSVQAEFEKEHLNLYREATADITAQILANVLVALEQSYGWKEKRLKDFVSALHATEDSMVTPSPLHKTYTTLDNEKHLKDKFGIDLRAEFPPNVEVKYAEDLYKERQHEQARAAI